MAGDDRAADQLELQQRGTICPRDEERFYPLLQELSYIRPLTFAAATAFAQGIDSDPDTHNSCNSGDFGSRYAFIEDTVTCAGLKPIGTGPFKLAQQETNADGVDIKAVFARHDDYWGGAPEIEFLHIRYYETTDDVQKDLLSGDLDMALEIGPLPPKQVQDLKYYHSDKVDVRHSEVMQNALVIMEYQQGAHEPHVRYRDAPRHHSRRRQVSIHQERVCRAGAARVPADAV